MKTKVQWTIRTLGKWIVYEKKAKKNLTIPKSSDTFFHVSINNKQQQTTKHMCSPNNTNLGNLKSRKPKTTATKSPARNVALAVVVLNSLTRDELRAIATTINVPRGRSKDNTVDSLVTAIRTGKAHVKSLVTISTPPPAGQSFGGTTLLVKKLRTYKPDRIITAPPVTVSQ